MVVKESQLPLVSICMPTFNGASYLAEALESAITQTYPNLEIIVSDDSSTDDTLIIVDGFKGKTSIPIAVYSHLPQGIGANWNYCVQQAKGAYIKFLFQDDVLVPDCISKMIALALQYPKVGLVYSKRYFMYEELTSQLKDFIDYYGALHTYWQGLDVHIGVLHGTAYLKDRAFLNSPKNKIGEPTNVLLKASVFETVGYFDEVLEQALDYEYWYRVMTQYEIGFVDLELAGFRLHDAQASSLNKKKRLPDATLLYQRYYERVFRYLHPKNKLKLLKLYHPVFKTLVTIKRFLYVR